MRRFVAHSAVLTDFKDSALTTRALGNCKNRQSETDIAVARKSERFERGLKMRSRILLSLLSIIVSLQITSSFADRSSSGWAKRDAGQAEVVKNLIFGGPARKADRKYVIKSYSIVAEPKEMLTYTFVVRHADGTLDTFAAEEGPTPQFDRVFSGVSLDIKLERKTSDTSYPISLCIMMHTRTEGDAGFP